MHLRRLILVLLSVALAMSFVPATAEASSPAFGCGGGCCYPFYAQYGREHIPYFALHPPVYYSMWVPRTYGYSPFAYPFGSPTPEIEYPAPEKKPAPKTMVNPYAKPALEAAPITQAAPQTIYNPYVAAPLVADVRE